MMNMKILGIAFPLALVFLLGACNSGGSDDASTAIGRLSAANSSCTPMTEVSFPIPETPFYTLDPMGPISDVTCDWEHFQPATAFCVRPDAPELTPGGSGPLDANGSDPACRLSGFSGGDTGLYKGMIETPTLCPGCRRLFIDFDRIPEDQPDQFLFHAHGHVFYAIFSLNLTYTIDPVAHSPNTKNFTNDYLVSPPGTPISGVVSITDTYDKSYVTDTEHFAHTNLQGPYYIGPWYVNREGERIHGIYLDINIGSTNLGHPYLNAIRYVSGHNSGEVSCPDNAIPGYGDFNLLYFGCVERPGGSSIALNPYP